MKQQKLLCYLEKLEKNNCLSIAKIEQSAKVLSSNEEFSKHAWRVINSSDGIEYSFLNGQLLPRMHNNHFVVRRNKDSI